MHNTSHEFLFKIKINNRVKVIKPFIFQAYLQAIKNNRCGDIRIALAESSKQLSSNKGPRILQHTTRSNKVIDTEKTLEKSQLKNNGQIVTERKTTIEHEEVFIP